MYSNSSKMTMVIWLYPVNVLFCHKHSHEICKSDAHCLDNSTRSDLRTYRWDPTLAILNSKIRKFMKVILLCVQGPSGLGGPHGFRGKAYIARKGHKPRLVDYCFGFFWLVACMHCTCAACHRTLILIYPTIASFSGSHIRDNIFQLLTLEC